MDQPIGIIDSGVGGLTISNAIIKELPHESIIYLADSKNCPYGGKSSRQIFRLTEKMVEFLLAKDIKLLVVACNTITVTSIDKLREVYPQIPIIGIVPVIKTAAKKSKNKKIGVFSTKATAKSNYQKNLIDKYLQGYEVINIGSSALVPLIEKLDFENAEKVLKKELTVFRIARVDTLALGCSHFPLIKKLIQKNLKKVTVLDSSRAVTRQVKRVLSNNKILSKSQNPSYNFYTTARPETLNFFVNKLTKQGKTERISLR